MILADEDEGGEKNCLQGDNQCKKIKLAGVAEGILHGAPGRQWHGLCRDLAFGPRSRELYGRPLGQTTEMAVAQVRVESQPGQGTTFKIYLPFVPAHASDVTYR